MPNPTDRPRGAASRSPAGPSGGRPDPGPDPGADARVGPPRVNRVVLTAAALGITLFALWTLLQAELMTRWLGVVLALVSDRFGWFYFLAVLVWLGFVIAVALSRFGELRLGDDDARPEFGTLSWASMLFAAGIGIDLLFYSVSEPLFHFLHPLGGEPGTIAAARRSMELTFLHWGLSGWGVYTLVGMSLAYFTWRRGLPLAIRSTLVPLFGARVHGPLGDAVDTAAVLGTVFGIATSLGIGILQLNFGLHYMFGVPEGLATQTALAVLIVAGAAISAASGLNRGIRRLSEFNMLLALMLVLFVLASGDTVFLLNALVTNVGDYLRGFLRLSTETYAFDRPTAWLDAWTVFFWAWWIAWGPFVGLFLARISRGRTLREFVFGALLLPLGFMMVWMSVIGNSAIDQVMHAGPGAEAAARLAEQAVAQPGSSIYLFLETLPWVAVTSVAVSVLALVFFITSGDSGSLVLSSLSVTGADGRRDAPVWLRILWAAVIGLLTLALLFADGLEALQAAVVIMGLPFAIVLMLMMVSLHRALREEVPRDG